MSGTQLLSPATVADVLHNVITQPRDVMMDVVHVRPSSS
jgi:NADP-dependent 3-hydroxy acid dehydrogenase YdfG